MFCASHVYCSGGPLLPAGAEDEHTSTPVGDRPMSDVAMWERFKKYYIACEAVDVCVDVSRMKFTEAFLHEKDADIRKAFSEMDKLVAGAIANPDEGRMVGHYWLRDSSKAPNADIKKEIDTTLARIKKFAKAVHSGSIKP